MRTTLYALVDPRLPLRVRYVGKTTSALGARLSGHINKARCTKTPNHRFSWIRSLLAAGVRPQIEELEVVEGDGSSAEVQMIALCRMMSIEITNHTAGGEGAPGLVHTDEARARMSRARRGVPSPNKGTRMPETTRAKISAKLRGRTQTEEANEKRSKALKGRSFSPEHRANLSANHRTKLPSSQRF